MFWKLLPIDVTLGNVTDVKLAQLENAFWPTDVTFCAVMDCKLEQVSNVLRPIDVRLFGIVTDVRFVQFINK